MTGACHTQCQVSNISIKLTPLVSLCLGAAFISPQPKCPFLGTRPVRLICEEITTSFGSIKTPSHPSQPYPNNADYFWTIKVPDFSKAVELTFHRTFDIEQTSDCTGSYLEVRDGDGPDSVLVGRFCGSVRPSPISSSTNSLYIHFHSSNNQTMNTGFNATFRSVDTTQGKIGKRISCYFVCNCFQAGNVKGISLLFHISLPQWAFQQPLVEVLHLDADI